MALLAYGRQAVGLAARLVSSAVWPLPPWGCYTAAIRETDIWMSPAYWSCRGWVSCLLQHQCGDEFGKSQGHGIASSTLGTMRLVGRALSMAIVSFIFAANLGRAKITPEVAPQLITSTNLAFLVFAALCFIGIFCSLARGNVSREEREQG